MVRGQFLAGRVQSWRLPSDRPRRSASPCPRSRNASPAPSPSSAVNTATSPRWLRTVSNRGNRSTARPSRSPRPSTAPRPRPASTNFSSNSPSAEAEVHEPSATPGTRRRDHPRQAGRVRHRRPGRGGQPERGPAALAGRGRRRRRERGDAGAGDPRGRSKRRPAARGARRGGPAPGRAGHRRRDFFGRKPVLMVVEPESLCWLTGRMVEARDGVTWAEEFARFPALQAVVRDDGTGSGQGGEARACPPSRRRPARPRRRSTSSTRSAKGACPADDLGRGEPCPGAGRRGPEGVRPARPSGAIRQGHGAPLNRLWPQAERLWDQATAAEAAWNRARSAFEFFTPEGRLNDRAQAEAVVAAALPHLAARRGPRPGGCCSGGRASRSWIRRRSGWPGWGWSRTSCRRCWTWKVCVASPGGRRAHSGRRRRGAWRWPARSS